MTRGRLTVCHYNIRLYILSQCRQVYCPYNLMKLLSNHRTVLFASSIVLKYPKSKSSSFGLNYAVLKLPLLVINAFQSILNDALINADPRSISKQSLTVQIALHKTRTLVIGKINGQLNLPASERMHAVQCSCASWGRTPGPHFLHRNRVDSCRNHHPLKNKQKTNCN